MTVTMIEPSRPSPPERSAKGSAKPYITVNEDVNKHILEMTAEMNE